MSFIPLMIASQCFALSAAMIESNVVFLNSALTPICAAIAVPMSMSEPTAFVPWYDSSGGYVMSLQKTILPADLIAGGGVTPAAAALTSMSAARHCDGSSERAVKPH